MEGCLTEAYILLKMFARRQYGFAQSIAERLKTMNGVENAELLFGDYDVIVKLKAAKIHDIENLVIEEVSMIEGIGSSVTLLCVGEGVSKQEEQKTEAGYVFLSLNPGTKRDFITKIKAVKGVKEATF